MKLFFFMSGAKDIKDKTNPNPVADLTAILKASRPKVVYTHNLADKHDTHVSVALRAVAVLRALPEDMKPERVYGCEVWRALDWLPDDKKVKLDIGARENLAAALMGVFDSQISGGKLDLSSQLVIGVSQSGKAADVLEVIKRGNDDGAITVAVTNDEDSPLAKEARYHLYCNAGEEKSVAATKTFTAQAMLLARIVERVTGDRDLKAELDAAAGLAAESLTKETEIAAASKRFISDRDCYVLGRGMIYGLVLEASLKLQETTYIRSKSYASSDFHHGPFAVMDEGTKAILIAPNDESAADTLEMAKKLKSVKADVTLITNATEKFAGLYNADITTGKSAGKYNSFFAFAPVVQLFACTLAAAKGMSPDNPRGLKKVTITK